MTIAILSHSAVPSGAELSLLRSVRQLPDPSIVTLILAEDGPLVARAEAVGARVIVLPGSPRGRAARRGSRGVEQVRAAVALIGYARRLRLLLRSHAPVVVVGRSLRAAVYGRLATWGLGVPFVWSIHDRLTREYLGRAAPFFSRLLPHLVDGLIVNSRSTLDTVGTSPRHHVLVIPPPLDLDSAPAPEPAAGMSRAILLGRLAPWKGQDLAIRAFAGSVLKDTVTLDVIGGALFGEDDYAASLEDIAVECGVKTRVRFVGHVDDPRPHLRAADVLIHASVLPEPFGAVVVEGMLLGCIVVATKPGGPAESVHDGRTGLLVQAGDVDAMRQAMDRVATMPESERHRMVVAARRAARAYDSVTLSGELFGWLRDVGSGHARPGVSVSSCLLRRDEGEQP